MLCKLLKQFCAGMLLLLFMYASVYMLEMHFDNGDSWLVGLYFCVYVLISGIYWTWCAFFLVFGIVWIVKVRKVRNLL